MVLLLHNNRYIEVISHAMVILTNLLFAELKALFREIAIAIANES